MHETQRKSTSKCGERLWTSIGTGTLRRNGTSARHRKATDQDERLV